MIAAINKSSYFYSYYKHLNELMHTLEEDGMCHDTHVHTCSDASAGYTHGVAVARSSADIFTRPEQREHLWGRVDICLPTASLCRANEALGRLISSLIGLPRGAAAARTAGAHPARTHKNCPPPHQPIHVCLRHCAGGTGGRSRIHTLISDPPVGGHPHRMSGLLHDFTPPCTTRLRVLL